MGWNKANNGTGEHRGFRIFRLAMPDEVSGEDARFWRMMSRRCCWEVHGPKGYVGAARTLSGAKSLADAWLNNRALAVAFGEAVGTSLTHSFGSFVTVKVTIRLGAGCAWLDYTSFHYPSNESLCSPLIVQPFWHVCRAEGPRAARRDEPAIQAACWEDVEAHLR